MGRSGGKIIIKALKQQKHNSTVLNAEDKFNHLCDELLPSELLSPELLSAELSVLEKIARQDFLQQEISQLNLNQIGELASRRLNDKSLEAGNVHSFFWSMVETHVDRFQCYPFDINKALFSYLEVSEFPEDMVRNLVLQLESQFEKIHGRPLRKSTQLVCQKDTLDDEIKELRDSLKYAALVSECDE